MGRWTREELQAAHDNYVAVAATAAATGEWGPWADLFTDDVEYLEHHYGTFQGRDAVLAWISDTMSQFPNNHMTSFPHDWCVCDEERGWWICQLENRFSDPGDGEVYQEPNITILHYAGDMKFSYEEDVYNPMRFAPVVSAWMAAKKAHS
jgi:hypothetical protein